MADLGFAGPVKNRRGHGDAIPETVGEFQQVLVFHRGDRAPDGRVAEDLAEPAADRFGFRGLVENAADAAAEFFGGPTEVRLEDLPDIHTRRNTERIEHDLNGSAVGQIGHIFLGHDARDHPFIAMTPGHFVANGELALHGDIHFDELDHAGRELIALLELFLTLVGNLAQHIDLARGHLLDLVDLLDEQRVLVGEAEALQITCRNFLDDFARERGAFGEQTLVGFFVVQVGDEFLFIQQTGQALEPFVGEDADLIGQVSLQTKNLQGLDGLVAFVLFGALAAEDLDVDDGAFDAGRAVERSIANVPGLLSEDGAEQLLFRRKRRFTLGSDFADQNVARTNCGADANHATLVEVAKECFADIGNIAGDLLGAELGIAGLDFKLLDVNGSVIVFLDQLLTDQDGVLKVVASPRQESHQHIAAQRQLAAIGAGAIRQHLSLADAISHAHQRLLVNAGILVRTLEFDQRIDVRADFAAEHAGVIGFHANDNALGVHLIDDAIAAADHYRSGIASGDTFHARTHERRFATDERHGLTLHVGAHQGAIGVIVFEEWNQAGGNGDELLGRNVYVIDLFALLEDEVAGLTAIDQLRGDTAALIERHVRLGDDVAVFLPGREIEAVGLCGDTAPLEFFVYGIHFVALDDFTGFEFAVSRVDYLHVIHHAAAPYLAVGRFDKSEFVDARIAGKRADQANIRAFRRLDGADTAVVGGMDVADLKPGALPGEPPGT